MVIRYFILFFVFFSKTVGLSSVFNAKINSTCQNTLLTAFYGIWRKKWLFPELLPLLQYGDVEVIGREIDQQPTILAKFGVFPSKNMIPLFLCNSASNFQRKSQKIKNNGNQIFCFISLHFFQKPQCSAQFSMQK